MGRDIKLLHPELQIIVSQFLEECKKQNLPVLITETFRTKSEQDGLYAKGRTAPGNIVTNAKYPQSPHCWGVAFDFCRNVKGKEYSDSDGFFAKVGAIGKKLGLTWGGNFKSFVDKPHFELTKYMPNASYKTLLNKYGTPEAFKKTWIANKTPIPVVEKKIEPIIPPITKKEDDEMVTQTIININGNEYLVDRILKDGKNYIELRSFEKAGFTVNYDSIKKIPVINNPKS